MPLRDIALALVLLAALPAAVARPFIGVVVFAWLSLMNPHKLMYGFAQGLPWAQMIAMATLAGLVFTKDRALADSVGRYRIALTYLAWTAVTTVFAFSTESSLPKLVEFTKVQVMCLATLALLTSQRRIEWFAIAAIMSVAFYGIKGGVFTLSSGGNYRVWGPHGTVLGDNNQLGTALTMTIPMLYWLAHWVKPKWQKITVYGFMLLTAAAVLGTHSRGSFLAAAAMGAFLAFKSPRKFTALFVVGVSVTLALLFMPDAYWERIHSIANYEQDGSAQGRLAMWAGAIRVANSHLTGGGFDVYLSPLFLNYASELRAPHSIYFQALGEQGWIGLALMLAFWASIWFHCRRLIAGLKGRSTINT